MDVFLQYFRKGFEMKYKKIIIAFSLIGIALLAYLALVLLHEYNHYIELQNQNVEIMNLCILGWNFKTNTTGWVEFKGNATVEGEEIIWDK